MIAHIYCRLSQDSKAGPNYSLDKQEQECKKYCEGHDLKNICVHRVVGSARGSGISATNTYMNNVISEMVKGDTLIVYDVTRFSRNTLNGLLLLEKMVDKGVKIRTVKEKLGYDTIYDRLAFRQLLSLAEYESDQISERIKTSVEFRQQNGIKLGSAPYGYEAYRDREGGVRKIRRSISEYKLIVCVRNMINDGIPIDEVVVHMNDTSTYRGKKWTHDIVLRVYKMDEEFLRGDGGVVDGEELLRGDGGVVDGELLRGDGGVVDGELLREDDGVVVDEEDGRKKKKYSKKKRRGNDDLEGGRGKKLRRRI